MSDNDIKLFSSTNAHTDDDQRSAVINRALLSRLIDNNTGILPEDIVFNLFADVVYTLRTDLIELVDNGGFIWHGHFAEIPEIQGGISISDRGGSQFSVSGYLHVFEDDYAFYSTKKDDIAIVKVYKKTVSCSHTPLLDYSHEGSFYDVSSVPGPAVIDVLVLYPQSLFKGIENRTITIENRVNIAKTLTDKAFSTSGINAKIRIVGIEECQELEKDQVTDLLGMVVSGTGNEQKKGPAYDTVYLKREHHNADIVALLAPKQSPDAAGIASAIPQPPMHKYSDLAHATFSAWCGLNDPYNFSITFAHELGHLLGGQHDRVTQPHMPFSPEFDYARGYVAEDHSFVTLMGYSGFWQGKRYEAIPAYSASDKQWQGKKMGRPINQASPADSANLFRWSTGVVANYRGTIYPESYLHLNIEIKPNKLGGSVTPALAGPYKPGTKVSVTALPRAGHSFSHWSIDGDSTLNKSKMPIITLTMVRNTTILANFISLKDQEPELVLDKKLDEIKKHVDITVSHHDGKLETGTTVTVSCKPKKNTQLPSEYLGYTWVINSQQTSRLVLGEDFSFVVESDTTLSFSKPLNISRFTNYYSYFGINMDNEYGVLIRNAIQRVLPNKKIKFSLVNAPEHVTIVGDETVLSDNNGIATIRIRGGSEKTLPSKFMIKASTVDAPFHEISIPARLDNYHFIESENHNLNKRVTSGDTPDPVKFKLLKNAHPVPNTSFELVVEKIYGHGDAGVTLKDANVTTDSNGEGTIYFNKINDTNGGVYVISVKKNTPPKHPFDDFPIAGLDVFPTNCQLGVNIDNLAGHPLLTITSNPQIYSRYNSHGTWDSIGIHIDGVDESKIKIDKGVLLSDIDKFSVYPMVQFVTPISNEITITVSGKNCISGHLKINGNS